MEKQGDSNVINLRDIKFHIKNYYMRYKGAFKEENTNPRLNDVKHLFMSVVHMCEFVIDNFSRFSEDDIVGFYRLLGSMDTIHDPLESADIRNQKAILVETMVEQQSKHLTLLYGYDPNRATVTREQVIKLYEEIKFDVDFMMNEYIVDLSRFADERKKESMQIQYSEVIPCIESLLEIVLSATLGKIDIPMSDAEITLKNCRVLINSFRRTLYSGEVDEFNKNMLETWNLIDKVKNIYHLDSGDKKMG